MGKLNLTFWGGAGKTTGANFLLEDDKTKILIDCGLFQGEKDSDQKNREKFPYDPKTIDYLFLTHAHMDHVGRVCKLVRDGFSGVIYSSEETKELSKLMLADAINIMRTEKEKSGLDPFYNEQDLDHALALWKTIKLYEVKELNKDFFVSTKDAGHILGSTMYEFKYISPKNKDIKILFTGDSGNSPAPLLRDTDSISGVDYLVMDSVYGDRNHEPKKERDEKFRKIIIETIKRGGTLVIPAFSIERTQVILYELNNLIEERKIPFVRVFLDSPLGEKVTEVYKKFKKNFNNTIQGEIKGGDDIFNFPKLTIIQNKNDSQKIKQSPNPKIIIAGSGMSEGGRVMSHEIDYLPDPKNTILLVGFQATGTLGRKIQDKPNEVKINGKMVPVRAKIEMISGYSSHKDSNHLLEMVSQTADTVKKVFVVMGEPKASSFLAQRLREYVEVDAVCPERGVKYELD